MSPDFLDLLRALSEAEARFLVIGAYAVGVHGASKVIAADLRKPGIGLQIGVEPGRMTS